MTSATNEIGIEDALPSKALRLADMIEELVAELHRAPLDDDARSSILRLYRSTMVEVTAAVSDDLSSEFERLRSVGLESTASYDEIRIAMTQLAGWLNGLVVGAMTAATARGTNV